LPALKTFGLSIIYLAIHVTLDGVFPSGPLYQPGGLDDMSILYRLLYLWLSMLGNRCRYYFAWTLSEGSGIMAGLGFNGYDSSGNEKWDRLMNVDVLRIEFADTPRLLTTYWNFATANWLKNYVYLRQAKSIQHKVPKWAVYLTNMVSAFWHGFYPSYYLSFFKAAVEVDIGRRIRQTLRKYVVTGSGRDEKNIYPRKYIYNFGGWVLTTFIFNIGMAVFVGLSFENIYYLAANYYHIWWIAPAVLNLVFALIDRTNSRNKPVKPKTE
jgi:lysophospholipid acyltransferase